MDHQNMKRRDLLKVGACGLVGLAAGDALQVAAADEAPKARAAFDRERAQARISGCFIPMPTLFHGDNLDVNLKGMRRHTRFMLDGGVREGNGVLMVSGSAGDFTSLSIDERIAILEAVLDEAGGKVGVVLGVQSVNPREVLTLGRAAAKLKAAAIQVSPPFYQTYTDDDVFAFYKLVNDSVDVPMIFYYTYWQYKLSLELVSRVLDLPNVIALKWAAPGAFMYNKGLRLFAKRTCIIDNQLQFVQSHMMGARGIDTHPSNFWPEWGVELWGLLEKGKYKEAEDSINRVCMPAYDLIEEISQFTGSEGNSDKLCLELVGLDASRVRPPVRDFRDRFRDKARKMLKDAGVPRVK
jgi:dihydrodipicolinate synthase/N-acetylneuraminate lyase